MTKDVANLSLRKLIPHCRCMLALTLVLTILSLTSHTQTLAEAFANKPPIEPKLKINKLEVSDDYIDETFLQFPTPIYSDNTIFLKPISISSSTLADSVSINLSQFNAPIFINQLVIEGSLYAIGARIRNDFISYYLSLMGPARLSGSFFAQSTKFYRLTCHMVCDFSLAHFFKKVTFSAALFRESALFEGAYFKGPVDFFDATFEKGANFSRSTFLHLINFNKATILNGADFSYSTFSDSISFRGALMEGVLDLSYAKIAKEIDLTSVEQLHHDEKILINLTGTNINNLILNYDIFQLYFPLGVSREDKENTYTALLKNFDNAGLHNSYRKLYSEYREFQYLADTRILANFINKNFWNYGQDKDRVFLWLGAIFIIYTIINAFFYRILVENYCHIEFLQNIDTSKEKSLHPILRFVYFLPYSFVLTFILFAGVFLKLGVTITSIQGRSFLVLSYLLSITVVGFSSLFFILSFLVVGK